MNCESIREKLDELLGHRLASSEARSVEAHLSECSACQQALRDYETLRQVLAEPVYLPQPLETRLWRRLEREKERRWRNLLPSGWTVLQSWWRDLDRTLFWSRISAVPAAVLGLLVLVSLFPRYDLEEWSYSVFLNRSRFSQGEPSQVTIEVSQPRTQFNGLMETVWKIPYEDSLWLVADIQPDGNAEIGRVIQYPKNADLLEAVDQTLRHSKFEIQDKLAQPFAIYAFQKVDVYEARVF